MGKQWKQCQTLFLGAPKSLQMVIAAMKLKDAYFLDQTAAETSSIQEYSEKQILRPSLNQRTLT